MIKILFPFLDKSLSKEIQESLTKEYEQADKMMLIVSIVSFLIVALITSYSNEAYKIGIIGGGITLASTIIAYKVFKGTVLSRIIFGTAFVIYPAIMISQQLGMSQTELKKLLFGEDVIQDVVTNYDNPLFKLRKDIWTFINRSDE